MTRIVDPTSTNVTISVPMSRTKINGFRITVDFYRCGSGRFGTPEIEMRHQTLPIELMKDIYVHKTVWLSYRRHDQVFLMSISVDGETVCESKSSLCVYFDIHSFLLS